MRLIDADVLIKAIEMKETEPSYQHTGEDWNIGLIMAEEIVWEQPTIEPQKWISCSERLPEKKSDVLVTISDGFNPFVDTDLWDGSRFFCYGNHRVEAWQPLPDPWKEEE